MQDVIFNLYAMNCAEKVAYKEIYAYHYRINNNSVCVRYNPNIFDIFFQVISQFEKFIENNKKNDEYFQALFFKTILMYIEGVRISIMHKDNHLSFFKKIKQLRTVYNNEYIKRAFKNIKLCNLNIKMKLFVIVCNLKFFLLTYYMIYIFIKSKSKEQE